jgi:hypothetical protein
VIRPLADIDITFETLLMWRKQDTSPLVGAFRATAREVWSQREKKAENEVRMQVLQAVDAANSRVSSDVLHSSETTKHQPR